ncbi:isochorismatase hydrolase [Gigaspora margarita]|uniref:Isochorismatase hydrolase n=1 Tax=Gigaspora margarita TaxID=4874 RepID=A0A8H3ZW21_GIGMA|nr:isochorismatase hydrolase [Gigaspora margarita]
MSTPIPYDPEKAALLVIDMQEFFRSDTVNEIVPNIKSIVSTCHKKGIPVLWTQHGHMNLEFDGGSLARWWKNKDEMIMRGSEKWKIMKELNSLVMRSSTPADTLDFIIQSKTRYDAFYKTELTPFSPLSDATATDTKEMHEASLLNIGFGWGIVTTVNNTVEWLSTMKL